MSAIYTVVGASTVITLRAYQLDIAVQLPSEQQNTSIGGLLGNYNGNADDDLTSSTGETLDPNSNEETIYYKFGETCELMNVKLVIVVPTGACHANRLHVHADNEKCCMGLHSKHFASVHVRSLPIYE